MQVSQMTFFIFSPFKKMKINENKFPKDEYFFSLHFSPYSILNIIYIYGNICPWIKDGLTFWSSCADVNNSPNKVVVCYVKSWAANRRGNGQFLVENIDPMLCTHIIYAFADLDNVTHSIQISRQNIQNMHNFQF